MVRYSLYSGLLSRGALLKAFSKVKSAKGAAGTDGQSINDFNRSLHDNADQLLAELQTGSYQPQAVRRVEIPKPTGGVRLLGIPAVRDRVVQQALPDILQPIFDPEFHPSGYGYRPGRSCHQAIAEATMFIREYDRKWVVDMDLSKCFDTLDHSLIQRAFRKRIKDGGIPGLLLTVNRDKTRICSSWNGVKFPGVSIYSSCIRIQEGKMKAFREKVKAMTRRNSPVNPVKVIKDLNPVLRGSAYYFRIANCSSTLKLLSARLRRRLRAVQLKLRKKPQRLHRRLRQLGCHGEFDAIKMNSWMNAACPLSRYALPDKYLHKEPGIFEWTGPVLLQEFLFRYEGE